MWDKIFLSGKDFSPFSEHLLLKLREERLIPLQGDVLDIGCGTGQLLSLFHRYEYTVFGIDISNEALKLAKQRCKGSIALDTIDIDNIAALSNYLKNKNFDIITCKLVWAFLQNRDDVLVLLKYTLNKEGVFLLQTPIRSYSVVQSKHVKEISVDEEELLSLLKFVFSSISIIDETFFLETGILKTYVCTY